MTEQILDESGSRDNPDNHHCGAWRVRWLNIRRASLLQQAEAIQQQRRAILAEVGEIEKELNDDLRKEK